MDVVKVVEPGPVYVLTNAMQQVVKSGTAAAMKSKLAPELNIAGKTGTTDDYRDSWFAGFSGNRLAVVWLGRDDNKPTGLTGASGALRVWMDLMSGLTLDPIESPAPADVEEIWVDPHRGLRLSQGCRRGEQLPFVLGSGPKGSTSCGGGGGGSVAERRTEPADAADLDMPADNTDGGGNGSGSGGGEMSDFFQRLMN